MRNSCQDTGNSLESSIEKMWSDIDDNTLFIPNPMTLLFMSFFVLINPHFPATHRETLYRSFGLIYQVDKDFINFFCLAMLSRVLPFRLLQQPNYAIRIFLL